MGTTFRFTRRGFGQMALGLAASALLPGRGFAASPTETPLHGLSAFGDLKYPADFSHFGYATPDAPAGGQFNMSVPNWALNQSPLTFDTLNTFVLKGNAPPRIEKLYDGLMTSSLDEPDSLYCALASSVTISADRNAYVFALRPEATFSSGAKVTAEDVVFSYETFKEKGHPSLQITLQELDAVVAEAPDRVRLVFSGRQTDQDALGAFGIPIVPKAFFDAEAFENVTAKPIPGSGRFEVKAFEFGRYVEYGKRQDYWARDMAFARGLDHFDTIRIDFFRDRTIGFEAFKKGNITFREEFTSKTWATDYGFPAVVEGKVIKREFPREKTPTFQSWALNQRRERFADRNVRHAINLCFDFEWTNAQMFYGIYEHSDSCFETSDFKAEGPPSPAELKILEPLRDKLPEEVFGDVWTQPVSDGSGRDRARLREALGLLAEAGWKQAEGKLVNAAGQPFALEYMIDDQGFERVYSKFIQNLTSLGIDASFRLVDGAQYQERKNRFDYDLIGGAFSLGSTPTRDTLVGLFGSLTRDREGSNNFVGMADPAVDALIDVVNRAEDRKSLTMAMRALDRVLRARFDWIPNIHSESHRAAYWDMFGFREPKPDYGWPVERLWWLDEAKARAIGKA
ncbi:extracellular solute-binding protein [Aurantimonas sp. 22II-16-19i]|uniref:extracellular solute-binding protein n=1 Tax=Aurantimonas sp. 22II-16-19i TaxID=1317114 RepID=UPI0009F7E2A5|nr:extracellular solute-binding protein [Aurantimonas sp. 22II-16-19i]ORE98598.1 ABC-type oligopeptide transport system, periplasmic component [Aurantimonas sp. 22II-16-19i]